MTMSYFGKLCDYGRNKEDLQSYIEYLELFFAGNNIDDVQKKTALFS